MNILLLGSGMMGRAIAFDLLKTCSDITLTLADANKHRLHTTKQFLNNKSLQTINLDLHQRKDVEKQFRIADLVISAVPYHYNLSLTQLAIQTHSHFLDLGGNNDIVAKQRSFFKQAETNNVTILPDCGLAPGMISIITRDIIEYFDTTEYVKIRVGGVPLKPTPPLKYQIVFSAKGLINEYKEDALVLDKGRIKHIPSLTQLETLSFPPPFNTMEAFLTSGGCSTLPYTYQKTIGYLDYKTVRYPGHCATIKPFFDLGFANEKKIQLGKTSIAPRDVFIKILQESLPTNNPDAVLMKIIAKGVKNNEKQQIEYLMIDYYDKENNITAMMRTTAYPISIIAQMIIQGDIFRYGVFCNEEIVPPKLFFKELEKRNIEIKKTITKSSYV
jgi:lysine 6-dehydrogenase